MNPVQLAQIRHRAMRWHLLAALDLSRDQGMTTEALLPIVQSVYPDATEHEVRRELDYLEKRELVEIRKDPLDVWIAELARYGIDVVEYTVDCDAGISRPTITRG